VSIAIVIGVVAPVIGLYASYWINSASGATIVLVETAIFLVALLGTRRPSLARALQPPAA
jgi:manganese/iron transport system permease protein